MISVVIPLYNGAQYLAETLQSVWAQTMQPTEIVVVNDGSTDHFMQVLQPYLSRITLINRAENKGVSYTLNEGIKATSGKYIALLDADDLWTPNKLALQIDFLEKHPSIEACLCHIKQFISPELPETVKASIACPAEAQAGYLKIALVIRKTAFERIGGFLEEVNIGDFIEWFSRAKIMGLTYEMLPNVLAFRRLHPQGLSHKASYDKDILSVLKRKLDNKRQLK